MGVREYVAAGMIVLSFLGGWLFNGYRWETKLDAVKIEYARVLQAATEQASKEREKHADAISNVDTKHTKELDDARSEIERLRSDVSAGIVSLRVNARCGSGMSEGKSGSGVDNAESPTLDERARQHYFALRSGIEQVTKQLEACQDILRSERE